MKLNFWQWLGVVLLIIGLVLILMREKETPQKPQPGAPSSQPAALPVTQPAVPATQPG